jgi:hypothetical protein
MELGKNVWPDEKDNSDSHLIAYTKYGGLRT